jgi:hypothetical protein
MISKLFAAACIVAVTLTPAMTLQKFNTEACPPPVHVTAVASNHEVWVSWRENFDMNSPVLQGFVIYRNGKAVYRDNVDFQGIMDAEVRVDATYKYQVACQTLEHISALSTPVYVTLRRLS